MKDVREMSSGSVKWFVLAQDRVQWYASVMILMNFQVSSLLGIS
jgi:hypothetical protein